MYTTPGQRVVVVKRLWWVWTLCLLLVLVIAAGWAFRGRPAGPTAAEMAGLAARVGALEQELAAARGQIQALEARVAELRSQVVHGQAHWAGTAGLTERATETVAALRDRDWSALSQFIHPRRGVRFSPYGYVNAGPDGDLVWGAADIAGLAAGGTRHRWGVFDGSGDPIEMTLAEYHARFIYDADFAAAPVVTYNQRAGHGNTLNNLPSVYPDADYVEYHFPGFEPKYEGMDWRSLRLVFEREGGEWYLVGIVHDEWTI